MGLFIINVVCALILWGFAYIGLRQYEFAQQDGDTGLMKFLVHIILLVVISANIYNLVNKERNKSVPSSAVVEEIKK